jgi:hypothetical protein
MNPEIAGRILWKETRAQRAFWASILGLGAVIQLLPTLIGREYYRSAVDFHWFYSVNIIMSCCFAVGSTAIAFAGESENRTKSLFQRLPIRVADLLVGKLAWSVLGTYTLLLILAVTANVWGDAWGGPVANTTNSQLDFDPRRADFWIALTAPLPFLVIGVLGSLVLRDVLTTVTVAGAAAAVLMGVVSSSNWMVATLILIAVAVTDVLLVPNWLRDAIAPSLRMPLRGRAGSVAAAGHSTLSVRSSIPWRRTASSLLWKEWRQARAITFTLAASGAFVTGLFAAGESLGWRSSGWGWAKEWLFLISLCLMAVPLVFGVAAGRADRRDQAYRLLAGRGVSPNAYWLSKHAVWAGFMMATALWLLGWQRLMVAAFPLPQGHRATLWALAHDAAGTMISDPPGYIANPAGPGVTIAVFLFACFLWYALGHLLSLAIPSAMTSLVLGLIGSASIAFVWGMTGELAVPFWWTIGLFPLILLFAGWMRTGDWLVDRNSLAAWGRAGASLVVPLFAICCGAAVFRVIQIPTVTLPLELQSPQTAQAGEPRSVKQSLFVDALKALNVPPPREDPSDRIGAFGWAFGDEPTRDWVAANERARALALEAARQEPADFAELAVRRTQEKGGIVVEGGGLERHVWNLTTLLLYSARKAESEDKLEQALQDYVAIARLGDDLERSNRSPTFWALGATRSAALRAMDRWAIHPKQSSALIKQAIELFQRFEENAPLRSPQILRDWRTEREYFEDFIWKGNNPSPENRVAAETGFVRWCLPWELMRLQRLQDDLFWTALNEMQLAERELRDPGFVMHLSGFGSENWRAPWKWERTTLEPPLVSPNGSSWRWMAARRVDSAAASRIHLLVWAAADYRREHHQLPARLSELSPAYFSSIPIDPWTGREFLYEPKGLPAYLRSNDGTVEEKEPFIGSAGTDDCRFQINTVRGPEIVPVWLLTRSGRDLNRGGPAPLTIDYPAPVVAIPDPNRTQRPTDAPESKPVLKAPRPSPAKGASPAPSATKR